MSLTDTIAASATGPGRSARAIVRLSGPGVAAALLELTHSQPPRGASVARLSLINHGPDPQPSRAPLADLPALLVRAAAPHSYTGEDTAELLIPGNPTLVQRLLARLTSLTTTTVRLAHPGEFTARAYLHGKLDLDRAEGVAATIAARSDDELKAARQLLGGTVGRTYRAWADEAATLLALVESGVDFSDQESVVAIAPERLSARLASLVHAIESFLGATAGAEPDSHTPTAVMVGPPNAGKSTLFNALLGRPRAITSPRAGTTRDALREPLDLSRELPGATTIDLVDLAGLDDSTVFGPTDAAAQAAARDAIAHADAAVYCDPSGVFPHRGELAPIRTIIRVRTKADVPFAARDSAAAPAAAQSAAVESLPVCALDGWNLSPLRRALADVSGGGRASGLAALLPRHRSALAAALVALRRTKHLADQPLNDQAVVADTLRAALDSLGELVGRVSPDDILGRIFSTFCVGK